MDIAETIKFRDICQMLEKIKSAENEAAKIKYLRRYYESFLKHRERFRHQMNISQDDENGSTSFYSILRCLIPNADRAREAYGLQISTLGKVYVKVLQLAPDSRDAERLYSKSNVGPRGGDYADTVFTVLKPRCKTEPSNLNMKEMHSMLDSIACEDRRNTEKELTHLCETASAQEQKWFIRLLLKSMHLRIREQSVLALLHPQAKEIFQRCSDLSLLCCMLANNKITTPNTDKSKTAAGDHLNLNDTIQPFRHIRPMLCEVFPGNIETLMSADVLYMETKMDGERFQLHYNEGRFMYISRNGIDYTNTFGADYSSGSLTPLLQNLLPIGMQSIILDGEMMVWDTRALRFRVKAENTDVKHLRPAGTGGTWQPCFVVYDLLYLNGQALLDLPYVQRTYKLREILKEESGVLKTMKPRKIGSKEEFGRLFQEALNAHEEGVVLKKQNVRYSPGTRAGGGWYKAKADYIKGLTTEFDLLIMGGFYNRKRTFIQSFLLGVLRYVSPREYYVYSVGSVLNVIRQRVVLNDTLREHWRDINSEAPPIWYNYKNTAEGRPDVWIDPKQSSILQIKAADLAPASAYMLEKSLHFPRIQAWRNDKVWNECMTLDEFRDMCKQSNKGVLKINKRELRQEDYTTERKRYKMTPAQARKLGALAYENKIDPNEVAKNSEFLQGFKLCILSTKLNSGYTIADLKRLVVSNGGECVENPLPAEPKCITIAGDITYRVERLQKSKRYDIVSMSWLLDACEKERMQLRPTDMICMTDSLREQFEEHFDAYGDSYTQRVRVKDLKTLLDGLSDNTEISEKPLTAQEMLALELELFGDASTNYFRNICGYFYDVQQPAVNLAKLIFEWRGGCHSCNITTKCNKCNENIPYIFIDAATMASNDFKLWLNENSASNVKIVNINWILHSDRDQRRQDLHDYIWNGI